MRPTGPTDNLENALLDLHRQEEVYWQHHGHISWLLKCDPLRLIFLLLPMATAGGAPYLGSWSIERLWPIL